MTRELVHEEPMEIGGHTVHSEVPNGYEGPCAVRAADGTEKLICAFPSAPEAMRAAIYASTPDGGYGSTMIQPCTAQMVTHSEFSDWAF